ncbi:hypothetical protein BLA50215_07931 [Burkholderia lata]|uniref:twin-arginine translocation pathway signal protein n=1 Tax=Burkholderia lata (strain ATCC 17760 / DSM 23089 / LMG 22485 / NCIMB 9086 / R18194 / 383) TaxID=482957 RepID=UPI001453449C|nr:twin-arginine translocation pathway signal protein [Burkholderia lata]VWD64939.1 hypothetical protein BLA50215_07931 [Burkholderia lata]
MNIQRRHFVQGSAAAYVLLLSGGAGAAGKGMAAPAATPAAAPPIEKFIKASFGGGFSVRSYKQAGGRTYARIQHLGARYEVNSANLLDWQVVGIA